MDPLAELERLSPSHVNRLCIALGFGAGVALVVDMIVTLAAGGYYQYVRHTIGFVCIALVTLWYVRTSRRALTLIGEGAKALVNKHAPAEWSEEQKRQLLQQLPYESLARTFTLFGMRAMTAKLRVELMKAMR
ncbi:MAG: hypothetical protein L6Q71_00615 [Planctomycetes bacterium]|nr:hypothetical protein [Planctomycetota bacterium]NUQ35646.1 hypothetical protein [Planctomycetaceae bacterium]